MSLPAVAVSQTPESKFREYLAKEKKISADERSKVSRVPRVLHRQLAPGPQRFLILGKHQPQRHDRDGNQQDDERATNRRHGHETHLCN